MIKINHAQKCDHIVHTSRPFWLAIAYAPTRGAPNNANVLCRNIDNGEKAMCAFFSRLDAMIEGVYASKLPTKIYRRIYVDNFDPRNFAADNGAMKFLFFTGYAASEQRLVIRKNAPILITSEQTIHTDFHNLPFDLTVDEAIYEDYLKMRRDAGLFAVEETLDVINRQWDEDCLNVELAQAIARIPDTVVYTEDLKINQVAMYDPEFKQWHFVSLDDENE